nr:MAG TPA: hypothetical protein [Caudoviricetes sp.]
MRGTQALVGSPTGLPMLPTRFPSASKQLVTAPHLGQPLS